MSWDLSDNDENKVGSYTIEITASAGCTTVATTSYILTITHFCESLIVDIDCDNSIFKDGANANTLEYSLYSGDMILEWVTKSSRGRIRRVKTIIPYVEIKHGL